MNIIVSIYVGVIFLASVGGLISLRRAESARLQIPPQEKNKKLFYSIWVKVFLGLSAISFVMLGIPAFFAHDFSNYFTKIFTIASAIIFISSSFIALFYFVWICYKEIEINNDNIIFYDALKFRKLNINDIKFVKVERNRISIESHNGKFFIYFGMSNLKLIAKFLIQKTDEKNIEKNSYKNLVEIHKGNLPPFFRVSDYIWFS